MSSFKIRINKQLCNTLFDGGALNYLLLMIY